MDDDANEIARKHPLATQSGLELFCGLLVACGGMCPKCAYGTRVVSKKWAKCKKCGTKVLRRSMDDIEIVPAAPSGSADDKT